MITKAGEIEDINCADNKVAKPKWKAHDEISKEVIWTFLLSQFLLSRLIQG